MSRAIRGTGYDLCSRQDDMDLIDIQVLSSHPRQRRLLSGITWIFALGPLPLRFMPMHIQELVC